MAGENNHCEDGWAVTIHHVQHTHQHKGQHSVTPDLVELQLHFCVFIHYAALGERIKAFCSSDLYLEVSAK